MTTFNRRTRQKALYRWMEEINWRIHRCGFKDGFLACLMVIGFSVLLAWYLIEGLA